MTETSSNQAQLAATYGRLLTETGKRPSVRTLKAAARVSTDAAAQFLRNVAVSSEVPTVPDLSAPVQALWAVAWQSALDAARTETTEQLEALTADLVRATSDAEQQLQAAVEATQAQQEAERQLSEASDRVDALSQQLDALQADLAAARAQITDLQTAERAASTRADRAEATVDALQHVLNQLHPTPNAVGLRSDGVG